MNRSYSLNPLCPKFISIQGIFRKINFQIFKVYCIFLYLQDTTVFRTRPISVLLMAPQETSAQQATIALRPVAEEFPVLLVIIWIRQRVHSFQTAVYVL